MSPSFPMQVVRMAVRKASVPKLTTGGCEDGSGWGSEKGQSPSSEPMLLLRMELARMVRKASVPQAYPCWW